MYMEITDFFTAVLSIVVIMRSRMAWSVRDLDKD